MYCTGGIRCEKASSYLLGKGYKNVYQLNGGILKYLEHKSKDHSKWRGECFVFDYRVSLEHGLEKGQHDMCHACRMPLSEEDEIKRALCTRNIMSSLLRKPNTKKHEKI